MVEANVSRMLDVGWSWFELRDTKAGIRSAEKFISALLTGRKLNMPYWFSASRAPGETNLCPVQTQCAHSCFDFSSTLSFRALYFQRRGIWRCTRLDNNKREESLYRACMYNQSGNDNDWGIETFVEQRINCF